jgi:hypothetical protein
MIGLHSFIRMFRHSPFLIFRILGDFTLSGEREPREPSGFSKTNVSVRMDLCGVSLFLLFFDFLKLFGTTSWLFHGPNETHVTAVDSHHTL